LLPKSKGILTELQKKLLRTFSKVPNSDIFYLTGGTALAEFYFGHRRSFDLDIFTAEKGLIVPFSYALEEEFKQYFSLKVMKRFETFVEFEATDEKETIRVQLALDSPFRFDKPYDTEIGIKVNSYKDLVVDKLLAFYGRAEPRDAIDLYFIFKREDLWELVKLAKQKDPGFDLYWFAIALNKVKEYPDDIKDWPVEMIEEIDIKELKKSFSRLTNEVMYKIKSCKALKDNNINC